MNLTEAAAFLNVSARTLRLAVEAGEIRAEHPLSDGPWLFDRAELMSAAAEGSNNALVTVTGGLQYLQKISATYSFQTHSEVG
jgi:excisionase family DNA binding protein